MRERETGAKNHFFLTSDASVYQPKPRMTPEQRQRLLLQHREWVQQTEQRIQQQGQQQAAAAAAARQGAGRRLFAAAEEEDEPDEEEEAAAEVFSNYGASSLHRYCARMGIPVRGRVHPGDISEAASLRCGKNKAREEETRTERKSRCRKTRGKRGEKKGGR